MQAYTCVGGQNDADLTGVYAYQETAFKLFISRNDKEVRKQLCGWKQWSP